MAVRSRWLPPAAFVPLGSISGPPLASKTVAAHGIMLAVLVARTVTAPARLLAGAVVGRLRYHAVVSRDPSGVRA